MWLMCVYVFRSVLLQLHVFIIIFEVDVTLYINNLMPNCSLPVFGSQ